MSDYDNSNSGALFKNDRKERPNQPDYTGGWTDSEGREYRLSAWIKESKTGKKFFSLSATLKEDMPAPAKAEIDPEADIPF